MPAVGIQIEKPVKRPKQGAFAAPGRAYHRHEGPTRNSEADVYERRRPPVQEAEPVELNILPLIGHPHSVSGYSLTTILYPVRADFDDTLRLPDDASASSLVPPIACPRHKAVRLSVAKIIQFPGGDFNDKGDEADGTFSHNGRYPELMLLELGLSDGEVDMLVSGDPASRAMLVEIAPELTEADLSMIPILHCAVELLTAIRDEEPVRATAKGNLPAKMVKALTASGIHDDAPIRTSVNREADSVMLSWTRRLCQYGGLLSLRGGRFGLTKAGRSALETSNYSEIYRLMFECHLRKPELLDSYDLYEDGGTIGGSLPLLLYAARDTNYEFLYEEDFAALVAAVYGDTIFPSDELNHAVALKMFERFGGPFGLFSPGPSFEPPVNTGTDHYDRFGRWRKTPVFDRVFRWHADPPPRGVLRPEQAAVRWMDTAHGFEIDPEPDLDRYAMWHVEGCCLRAIERCPEDPDAYVVWARLYASRPEIALSIADLGIERSTTREPDMPEGMSPWSDHEFRDVIRLHFLRAETLVTLERHDEAFAEYNWLLELDPHDAIGAADHYVPALIQSGRYADAEKLLNSIAGEDDPFSMWNLVLTAYALGDKHTARERLARAIDLNPHVPECLLDRVRAPMPHEYMPGDVSEAIIYENQAFTAWKSVRGAREWLKRNTPDE